MKLTVKAVNAAKVQSKSYKLFDGDGLYLLVGTNGSRYWRIKYRFDGRERHFALGVYPDVSLAQARTDAREAKVKISKGINPSEEKKLKKAKAKGLLFKEIANEWQEKRAPTWSEKYAVQLSSALNTYIYPSLGNTLLSSIKPLQLLHVLEAAEAIAPTTAAKLRQWCGEIFTYAIITGRAEVNPATGLSRAMKRTTTEHFAHLEEHEIAGFLQSLEGTRYATERTYLAIRLLMIVGLRPGELVNAPWNEIDFERSTWDIPKERMKKRRPHMVPLSNQAITILERLRTLSAYSPYIFPNRNNPAKPMTKGALLTLINRIGYGGRVTPHGFRHTMSTILHEIGYNTLWIDTQIAHVDKNSIRRTYNHAQYLEGRREMLQWYADHIDSLSGL